VCVGGEHIVLDTRKSGQISSHESHSNEKSNSSENPEDPESRREESTKEEGSTPCTERVDEHGSSSGRGLVAESREEHVGDKHHVGHTSVCAADDECEDPP